MTIWRGEQRLILASQSAVRKSLLDNAGLAVETMPANIDERGIQQKSGLKDPGAIAALLAGEKAKHVSVSHPGRYVIGADQTLALGERLFSKPSGRDAAADQLKALAGRTHALHSAVSVVREGQSLFSHVGVARMTMRKLTPSEIASYLDAAGVAVTTSVGAYQLEGLGVNLFDTIDGDHFTILGLP
ncbi:MAG: Maf family protein, partial [Rhizobiales bacterium]|nr:Maf family protein [Hyphomicrobiales bacterium]